MLKKVLIGVAVVVVGFVALVASQPGEFRVERSAMLKAPVSMVFAKVNGFKNWGAWSPWDAMDPNIKKTFEGPPEGLGASYHWVGNDKVGEGTMTITESKTDESLAMKLEFLKPFESTAATAFTFKAVPEGASVTWAMTGQNSFVSKAMGLFVDMDKMIGSDFEKGLANLKKVTEAEAAQVKAANDAAPKTAEAPVDAAAMQPGHAP